MIFVEKILDHAQHSVLFDRVECRFDVHLDEEQPRSVVLALSRTRVPGLQLAVSLYQVGPDPMERSKDLICAEEG